jgi:hypothetical protein
MRSSAQALQQYANQRRIGAAFDPNLRLAKLDVNRAALGLRNVGKRRLDRNRCRLTLAHPHWQQFDPRLRLPKSPGQVQSAPAKYLIGVDPVRSSHPRHRRTGYQRLFDNPSLLGDASPLSLGYD